MGRERSIAESISLRNDRWVQDERILLLRKFGGFSGLGNRLVAS